LQKDLQTPPHARAALRVSQRVSERVAERAAELTPTERRVADYLLGDHLLHGYKSASELAKELSISPSTVVRFAQSLGYSGWLELQADLKHENSQRQRLVELAPGTGEFLSAFVNVEIENLRSLLDQDLELDEAATLLAEAEKVWLVGNRASKHVAGVMHHFLSMTRPDVRLLAGDVGVTPDVLLDVGPNQVAFVVFMARYASATLDIARYLAQHMPVVLLTDEFTSPLLSLATTRLRFATAGVTSWKSSTAAFAMTQALVMAVARKVPDARQRLQKAEQLWDEFKTYLEENR